MGSPRERQRNNVRAGLFVTVTMLVAMGIVFLLTDIKDIFLTSRHTYRVTYSVESGVKSLSAGSQVRVGGLPVGRVKDVALTSGATPPVIEVEFELPSDIVVRENARIVIIAALVGATSWLDIIRLGDDSTPVVSAGGMIEGAVSAGMLADVLGPDAPEMVADAKEFLALLGRVPDDYDSYIIPMLEDIRMVVDDAAENRYPTWVESVDRVMTWAESMTGRVEAIVDESHGSVVDVRTLIADSRPKIDRTLDNIEQSSAQVSDITTKVETFADDALVVSDDLKAISAEARERAPEIMATAERVLGRGQDAIDGAVALMGRVQQDYEGWSIDFDESLGNAALASQQIKLATIEIRRSPWKILYRPTSDELDHELLYEAARSFALGVTDLKTATLATERLLNEHGDRLLNDEQSMKRVRDNLLNSLDRYERAQSQLFDILLDDSPTK